MVNRRRASVTAAVLAGAVLMMTPGANAACVDQLGVCVPGGAELSSLPGGGDYWCVYTKFSNGAPEGWGNPDDGPPYVWTNTQTWGDQHRPPTWDKRACTVCRFEDGALLSASCTLPPNEVGYLLSTGVPLPGH
jgi:hypothetical protein